MQKIIWRSRKLYRNRGSTGRIVFCDSLKRYLFEDTFGRCGMIDQRFGAGIKEIETRIAPAGRPALFPGEEIQARTITLPIRVWDKLGTTPAIEIVRLTNG